MLLLVRGRRLLSLLSRETLDQCLNILPNSPIYRQLDPDCSTNSVLDLAHNTVVDKLDTVLLIVPVVVSTYVLLATSVLELGLYN